MKSNEAPEKIFLEKEKETDRIHHLWGRTPVVSSLYEHIEYTRTDVFIDKACELLARMIWEVTYEDLEGNSTQHYDKMEFIEDFKNHMKGE